MSDEKLGFCPLFKEKCYGEYCQWWKWFDEHRGGCSVELLGVYAMLKMKIIGIETEPYRDLDD